MTDVPGGGRPTIYPIFGPVEDILLNVLRDYFADKDVHIYAKYKEGIELPAIIPLNANRSGAIAYQTPEDPWVRSAMIEMNTIASGPERDVICAQLQEAARHALYEAWFAQKSYPGLGVLNKISNSAYARPESDWATSSHAVQYAKLPNGASRYESTYRILVRPPRSSTYNNPFISSPEGRT
jgi:hypothetical protein